MKKSAALLLTLFTSASVFASGFWKDVNFDISTDVGMYNGVENEYVFYKMTDGTYGKISELNWELYNIPVLELKSKVSYKNFYINLSGFYGLPFYDGNSMTDSDWQNIYLYIDRTTYLSNCPDKYRYVLTDYTKGTNEIKYLMEGGIKIGWDFNINSKNKISPFAGLDLNYIYMESYDHQGYHHGNSYEDSDGYLYYESLSSSVDDEGGIFEVSLNKYSYFTWIGAAYTFDIKHFSVNASAAISPFIYVDSLDNHSSEYFFYDRMFGYFQALKGDVYLFVKFNKHNSLYFNSSARYLFMARGKDYRASERTDVFSPTGAYGGASSWNVTASLGYKFTLR